MSWHPWGWNIDWGNAPAWTGTTLSTLSILLVVGVIMRDRRHEVRKQAAQIFVGIEYDQLPREGSDVGGTVTLTIHNSTDAPIRMALVEYSPFPGYWPTLVFEEFDRTYKLDDFLTPGTRTIFSDSYRAGSRVVKQKSEAFFYVSIPHRELGQRPVSLESTVGFYDINGHHWNATSPVGKLKQLKDRRPWVKLSKWRRKRKLRNRNVLLAESLAKQK